jgi:Deacetylase PdaC
MLRQLSKCIVATLWLGSVLCSAGAVICQQATVTRFYRGSIGGSHIEMRLDFVGNNISGTYSYDRIRQDLKLSGKLDAQGTLELTESAGGKPSGKLVCKRFGDANDQECMWSKTDGTGQAYLSLDEQYPAFTNGMRVVPKLVTNKKTGVNISYSQITGGSGELAPAIEKFNRLIGDKINKRIKEYESDAVAGRSSFETNYIVLLGTNDLVSIEMSEYSDVGGAHPNTGFWAMTYDLAGDKELALDDLFKATSDYKTAIAKYTLADINKRAVEIEQADARREGRKAEPRDEPLVSMDQLSDLEGWGMTPKGLTVYFDFAHVIAVFDKTFVPYSVVKDYLKPDGPAARFANVR